MFYITEIINLIKATHLFLKYRYYSLEGTLLTYYFLRNDAQTIIKRMRLKMDKIINDAGTKIFPILRLKMIY